MLKRLTCKLITLFVLIGTFAAIYTVPASSTNRFCFDGPITEDCATGRYCCDLSGNCTCGGN